MAEGECIFCRIAKGEVPASKVYNSKKFIAFLDIAPGNKGHCLVMPKTHYPTILDVPKKEMGEMSKVVKKISEAVVKSLEPNGLNILMNNMPAAGQVIPHAHIHIMPRFAEDGLKFDWPLRRYEEGEIEQYRKKIKNELKS